MTPDIRIVLIKTWHPGNIGAVARAMKNMGLYKLYLVDPLDFPSEEATSRSGQATDILENAVVVSELSEAINDCSLVIGTSARDRSISLPALTAEQCAEKAMHEQQAAPVAIVFGRERMGLLNEEIQQCHFQVNIDANPDYPVLNLSQAVQIICYELFKSSSKPPADGPEDAYPLHKELTQFQQHLESTTKAMGFINLNHPGQTLELMQAIFRRARLSRKDLSIMRGFLSSIDKKLDS
ncbi:RNA methyltransferase [Reinekea marinisedimentorum]|uniref:tRNA (cytidine/uridine-2'-O-)-methyltransferase TrmJ n=1 Tax=Reinekea marinisedimentorum TaxID=230495 RepID=A0A4R3I6V8_9GAMM|nr:RNA methyltransferase [Reinekea marinisedimentorum]TCS39819.1 tRNA (cytidine32/uridine32-2'-O)-methyltransferase [Reinekea marinisedimentorum]